MPQYKLKVFFRLRYMIIIGLPIICFRKQQRQRGKGDQVGENMKTHFGNNSFDKRIITTVISKWKERVTVRFHNAESKQYSEPPITGDLKALGAHLRTSLTNTATHQCLRISRTALGPAPRQVSHRLPHQEAEAGEWSLLE